MLKVFCQLLQPQRLNPYSQTTPVWLEFWSKAEYKIIHFPPKDIHTFSASLPKASSLKIAVGHHRRIGNLNRKICLTCCNQILSLSSNSWSPLRRWPRCFKFQLLGGEGRGTLSFLALAHMLDATQGTGGAGWATVMYVSVAHMWQELRL